VTLTPAPLYDDVAQGPHKGAAYWLKAEDGVRIRIGVWDGGDRGTVLLFPGRTEYVEKYGAAAAGFHARGFSTVVIDWRGQGLADRPLDKPAIGHVDDFTEYQRDLRAVLSAVAQLDIPQNLSLFAHSMGGCIGLRSLMEGLEVNAAVFTGPMWGISLDPMRRAAGWAISSISRKAGFDTTIAPGTLEQTYVLAHPFEDNMLTTDKAMFDYMRHQLETHPGLALGGPSLAWLNEGLRECHALSLRPTPNIPALTYLGTNERIVDVKAIHDRMARWPAGKLHLIEGAEHEIIMELPITRDRVLDEAAALYLGELGAGT
jgi:lysophospholipase